MKTHNGMLALWKFIYCFTIIGLHVSAALNYKHGMFFNGASIAVSFFFLVSGYYMGKNAMKLEVDDKEIGIFTFNYIKHKIKKLFPYMLFSIIMTIFALAISNQINKLIVFNSIWEILFLGSSGIRYVAVNYVTWYISSMIIGILFLYPLILKYKRNFIYVIGPILILVIGGYVASNYMTLQAGDFVKKNLMAIFIMCIGSCMYDYVEKFKKVDFSRFGKILLNLLSLMGFALVIVLMNFEQSHQKYDFIMLLLLTISIFISLINEENNNFNNKLNYFLEKISLPMYLNQVWLIYLIYYIETKMGLAVNNYIIFIPVLLADFFVSYLLLLVIPKIKIKNIIKRIFTEERENE